MPREFLQLIRDFQRCRRPAKPFCGFSCRPFLQIQRQHDILTHRQGIQQVVFLKDEAQPVPAKGRQFLLPHVRNVPAFQNDAAGTWLVDGGNHVQKGAFAGAGGTHDGGEFSAFHRKADAVQRSGHRVAAAVAFGYIFDFK